jgi:hypothetical protein
MSTSGFTTSGLKEQGTVDRVVNNHVVIQWQMVWPSSDQKLVIYIITWNHASVQLPIKDSTNGNFGGTR